MQPDGQDGAPSDAGGGGGIVPEGPVLPDQVPDGVQTLVDGIFSFGGDLGRGFGEFVSGLAGAIGGGGEAAILGPHVLDQVVATTGVVA